MSHQLSPSTTVRRTAIVLGAALALAGCSAPAASDTAQSPVAEEGTTSQSPEAQGGTERMAEKLVQVSSVHPETGMTLIEGPTFGPDGSLFIVDVTAPAGEPKVLKVDVETRGVSPVFTDSTSAYTSAQFSPQDGRIYLTDFAGGKIDSITAEGTDPKTFFTGAVEGADMRPDDLAFDEEGNLYVSDSTGYADPSWEASGRVVRIDKDTAQASVLADNLAAPNGISFTADFSALWVNQYMDNRIDYMLLNQDKTAVETSHPAVFFSGGASQMDSNAVDAAGNIYQAVHGQPRMFIYSPQGELLSTVSVPAGDAEGLTSATNVAIAPGTTDAYMTVSGPDGGFIYTFEALAEGTQQSNGG